jgi:hypothetical protein
MANSTAQKRPLNGTMRLKAPPATAEDIRKQQVSAHRVKLAQRCATRQATDMRGEDAVAA